MTDIPETLYHYCSSQTFHSIISSKSIRLSSLNLSNDTMEGQWAVERFGDACLKAGLGLEWLLDVKVYASRVLQRFGGLGLCLSRAPDMLSQWRGYADDGFGFCLGFNTRKLIDVVHLPARWPTLLGVEYNEGIQIEKLRGVAHDVVGLVNAGALLWSKDSDLSGYPNEEQAQIRRQQEMLENRVNTLAFYLYGMKNPVFNEEQEWRLFAPYVPDDISLDAVTYEYAVQRDRIKPFRSFDIKSGYSIFDAIYIGPRNITPVPVVEHFVRHHLAVKVEINPSKATYR